MGNRGPSITTDKFYLLTQEDLEYLELPTGQFEKDGVSFFWSKELNCFKAGSSPTEVPYLYTRPDYENHYWTYVKDLPKEEPPSAWTAFSLALRWKKAHQIFTEEVAHPGTTRLSGPPTPKRTATPPNNPVPPKRISRQVSRADTPPDTPVQTRTRSPSPISIDPATIALPPSRIPTPGPHYIPLPSIVPTPPTIMATQVVQMTDAQLQQLIGAAKPAATIRVKDVDDFSGKPSDLNPFLRRVENHFKASGVVNVPDANIIAYAVSHMNKGAGRAFQNLYHQRGLSFSSWNIFCDTLRNRFKVHEEKSALIEELATMRQGKTDTLTHCIDFANVAETAGYVDTEFDPANPTQVANYHDFYTMVTFFKKSLRESLLVKANSVVPAPNSMEKWYSLVTQLTSQNEHWFSKGSSNSNSSKDPNAMEIDAIVPDDGFVSKLTKGQRLSKDQMDLLRKMRRCFYCFKLNHGARDCRTKKRDLQNQGRSGNAQINAAIPTAPATAPAPTNAPAIPTAPPTYAPTNTNPFDIYSIWAAMKPEEKHKFYEDTGDEDF